VVDRLFTLDEAREALSVVRPLAERLVEHRRAQRDALEARGEAAAHVAGNGGGSAGHDLAGHTEEVDRAVAGITECLRELDELGVQVKDLDRGLLDFPALRGDEVVLLCWHVGEDDIGWWHGESDGFAGRRPLPL
jgi:hypothetical protein